VTIKSSFFSGVDKTSCPKITIPFSNLNPATIYTVSVTVTQTSTSIAVTQAVSFTTKTFNAIRSTDELNIDPSAIYVNPSTGVQGSTDFTAGYSFGSIPAF
jgi:hypothetical protein